MMRLISRWLRLPARTSRRMQQGLQPVRGKVHFPDGAPLDQGKVVLSSVDGIHGASSLTIGKDGTFALGSYSADDGVPPGKYTVVIVGATRNRRRVSPGPAEVPHSRAVRGPAKSD